MDDDDLQKRLKLINEVLKGLLALSNEQVQALEPDGYKGWIYIQGIGRTNPLGAQLALARHTDGVLVQLKKKIKKQK